MDQYVVRPSRSYGRSIAILSAQLSAFVAVAACFAMVVSPSIRTLSYMVQLTVGAAAGPLYVVTASLTGQSAERYAVVGPASGGAVTAARLVAVWGTRLRRLPVAAHLLLSLLWLVVGVFLTSRFGGK